MFTKTFSEFEEKFIRTDSKMDRSQKIIILREIIEKHNYDRLLCRILAGCFDYISDEHKIYIPTNDDFAVAKVNEMGIRFHLDFDEEYIRELGNLFLDDNYEFKYYDLYYFKNLCNMDIKFIKKKYPNVRVSAIRCVLMYIEKDKLDDVFAYLNNKSLNFQSDYCKLITPLIIDTTTDKGTFNYNEFVDCLLDKSKFCPYNHYDHLNVYEYVWMVDSETNFLNKGYYKTTNTMFIESFNNYFEDLLNKFSNKLDDNLIGFLCKIKECLLNHIPDVTGDIHRENIYKTVTYYCGDDDREAACCPGCYSVDEDIVIGQKNVSTLNFKENEFSKIKELLEEIFKMLLNGEIDYKKLMKYNQNDLILDIFSNLEKGKELYYGN